MSTSKYIILSKGNSIYEVCNVTKLEIVKNSNLVNAEILEEYITSDGLKLTTKHKVYCKYNQLFDTVEDAEEYLKSEITYR